MENFQMFHLTCKGLVFYKNKFLLYKANDPDFFGSLECPGGRVNCGELIEDVLRRELLEEINLDLKKTQNSVELFAINQRDELEYGYDPKIQIIEIYFKIIIPSHEQLDITPLEEIASLQWIDKNTELENFPYRVVSRKKIYKKAQGLL